MTSWASADEILLRAKDLIRERGWQQAATASVSSLCAATALEAAFNAGQFTIVDFNHALHALKTTIRVPQRDERPVPYWGSPLMEWNDSSDRTVDQVLEAFDKAAALARAEAAKAAS